MPELAAEMTVFITIWFGPISSLEIWVMAAAFMNREVIRIMRVPATRRLTLDAEKVRVVFCLYILNIKTICLFVSYLNYGFSLRNLSMF
jgi:hypothetical protein